MQIMRPCVGIIVSLERVSSPFSAFSLCVLDHELLLPQTMNADDLTTLTTFNFDVPEGDDSEEWGLYQVFNKFKAAVSGQTPASTCTHSDEELRSTGTCPCLYIRKASVTDKDIGYRIHGRVRTEAYICYNTNTTSFLQELYLYYWIAYSELNTSTNINSSDYSDSISSARGRYQQTTATAAAATR